MTEEQLKQEAGLYALGMLNGPELRHFERRLDDFPDLHEYVAELEDAVAAVALTAPAEEADPEILDRVLDRIGHGREPRIRRFGKRILTFPGGWPAAAALLLLLGWGGVRYGKKNGEVARLEGERAAMTRDIRILIGELEGNSSESIANSADGAISGGATESGVADLVHVAQKRSYHLLQDLDRVKLALAKFQSREAERATAHPGIARPVVVAMWDPDVPPEERENQHMLSEEVSNIIGDSLEAAGADDADKDAETTEPDDEVEADAPAAIAPPKMSFDSWPEVEIVGDALAPLWFTRDLPNGPNLRHKDFPADRWEQLGLTRYEDGTFFDPDSNLLYKPSSNGSDYLGRRPPAGFDPDVGVVPATPPPAPDPEVVTTTPAAIAEPVAEPTFEPKAFTLYDETTGEGSIILQNLPPRAEDVAYHLWLNDLQGDAPIEVGVLPDLESGDGRVFFELQPGLSPSGYILTAEPRSESPLKPGDKVLLFGP